jgi:hypothetical protein
LRAFLICPMSATWTAPHILLDLVKCTSHEAPHYAVFSKLPPLLPPWFQIFAYALSFRSPSVYVLLLVWETKYHTHRKQRVRLCLFFILIFKSLKRRRQDRRFWAEWYQTFPEFNMLLISLWMQFWFATIVPKYLNFTTFSKDSLSVRRWWFCPPFWWRDIMII